MTRSGTVLRRDRALATGAGLVAAYVVVVLATAWLSGRPAQPLFDGFSPPPDYDWVNPPPGLPRANRVPAGADAVAPLSGRGSAAAAVATADDQATLTLEAGSVAARAPATGVRVALTPLDPATLGPLPPGLRPESNAYRVSLTYVPPGSAVEALVGPGTIALTAAGPASALLFSPDGVQWRDTEALPFGVDHGLFAELEGPGFYVSVSRNAPRHAPAFSATARVLLVVAGAVVVSSAVAFAVPLRRAVRRRQE